MSPRIGVELCQFFMSRRISSVCLLAYSVRTLGFTSRILDLLPKSPRVRLKFEKIFDSQIIMLQWILIPAIKFLTTLARFLKSRSFVGDLQVRLEIRVAYIDD